MLSSLLQVEPWSVHFFVLYFQAWISDIRAGTAPSCGNHIKSSCSLIAFISDRPGREMPKVVEIPTLLP